MSRPRTPRAPCRIGALVSQHPRSLGSAGQPTPAAPVTAAGGFSFMQVRRVMPTSHNWIATEEGRYLRDRLRQRVEWCRAVEGSAPALDRLSAEFDRSPGTIARHLSATRTDPA